ncbi:hypothetical protein GQ600_10443 [Phytophthora cactorum]|nr:hypothetical protein GQ600_10443 [Phytophthora cactorum]
MRWQPAAAQQISACERLAGTASSPPHANPRPSGRPSSDPARVL